MGENSWIIDNLNAALNTWNEKLAEIWQLLTQGLADFKGGGGWNVMPVSYTHLTLYSMAWNLCWRSSTSYRALYHAPWVLRVQVD